MIELVGIDSQNYEQVRWSNSHHDDEVPGVIRTPASDEGLSFFRLAVGLTSDDAPGQQRVLHVEDVETIFLHLLLGVKCHHVLVKPNSSANLLQDSAGHGSIVPIFHEPGTDCEAALEHSGCSAKRANLQLAGVAPASLSPYTLHPFAAYSLAHRCWLHAVSLADGHLSQAGEWRRPGIRCGRPKRHGITDRSKGRGGGTTRRGRIVYGHRRRSMQNLPGKGGFMFDYTPDPHSGARITLNRGQTRI